MISSIIFQIVYKKVYENEIKGVGGRSLEKSPYFDHVRKATKLASKVRFVVRLRCSA